MAWLKLLVLQWYLKGNSLHSVGVYLECSSRYTPAEGCIQGHKWRIYYWDYDNGCICQKCWSIPFFFKRDILLILLTLSPLMIFWISNIWGAINVAHIAKPSTNNAWRFNGSRAWEKNAYIVKRCSALSDYLLFIFISGCVNDQPGGSDTLSAVKPLNEEVTVKKKMGTKGQRRCATPFLGTTWNRTLVTLFKRCVSVLLSHWLSQKLTIGELEFPCFSFKPRASPDVLQFWLLQHLENSFESVTLITYLSAGL